MSGGEIRTARQARQVLNLRADAGLDETRRAYRSAVRAAHPDHGGDAEQLRQVIDAHRLLVELHKARLHLPPAVTRPVAANPPAARAPTSFVLPLEISITLAVLGGGRSVKLPDGRRGKLKLPPGLRPGDMVRLARPEGDLLMSVVYAKGEYEARGDDLWTNLPAPPRLLEDGGQVDVDTPTGRKRVTVAPGASVVRLAGQGLPARGQHACGDLFVRLRADETLGRSRACDLLRRFAASWAA